MLIRDRQTAMQSSSQQRVTMDIIQITVYINKSILLLTPDKYGQVSNHLVEQLLQIIRVLILRIVFYRIVYT